MIDYYKLKIAHELAEKYQIKNQYEISIELNFTHNLVEYILHVDMQHPNAFGNIDDLITKLTELTIPQPKFKAGELAYFKGPSGEYEIIKLCLQYDSNHPDYSGLDLYPTKSALIEAQIQYWSNMLDECEPKECQHKPGEGSLFIGTQTALKCIKCGEFY